MQTAEMCVLSPVLKTRNSNMFQKNTNLFNKGLRTFKWVGRGSVPALAREVHNSYSFMTARLYRSLSCAVGAGAGGGGNWREPNETTGGVFWKGVGWKQVDRGGLGGVG